MATKPTRETIRQRAERAMERMGQYPPDPGDLSFDPKLRAYDELYERQLANADAHLNRVYKQDLDQEQDAERREQEARAALEAPLLADYRLAAPGTSEAEAQAALTDLLHRHRLAKLDQDAAALAVASARARF